jgi:DSF synthase
MVRNNDSPSTHELRYVFSTHQGSEVQAFIDSRHAALHLCFNQSGVPSFTARLIDQIALIQKRILHSDARIKVDGEEISFKYVIIRSSRTGIFSLGGDLALFLELIRTKNAKALQKYGRRCIDVIWLNNNNYFLPIRTISLVQGACYGGGMEAALSSDVIIAEGQSRFRLPECEFGLFPGMGAFHFLRQKMPDAAARAMMIAGEAWSASEMYAGRVIDVIVEPGQGLQKLREYIRRTDSRHEATVALRRALTPRGTVDRKELTETVDRWALEAFTRSESHMVRLETLVRAQQRKYVGTRPNAPYHPRCGEGETFEPAFGAKVE